MIWALFLCPFQYKCVLSCAYSNPWWTFVVCSLSLHSFFHHYHNNRKQILIVLNSFLIFLLSVVLHSSSVQKKERYESRKRRLLRHLIVTGVYGRFSVHGRCEYFWFSFLPWINFDFAFYLEVPCHWASLVSSAWVSWNCVTGKWPIMKNWEDKSF